MFEPLVASRFLKILRERFYDQGFVTMPPIVRVYVSARGGLCNHFLGTHYFAAEDDFSILSRRESSRLFASVASCEAANFDTISRQLAPS